MTENSPGALLREWRVRRRLSQLDLASEAEISQRHLSFVESGRAKPSRDMVLHLADRLDIPLRERNHLLLAAGFAPRYGEHNLDDPSLAVARTGPSISPDAIALATICVLLRACSLKRSCSM